MEEIRNILEESLHIDFIQATISNPKTKGGVTKIKVRPVMVKGELLFQCETFENNQAFHKNYKREEAILYLAEIMEQFKQMQLETKQNQYTVLVSKKGKVTVKKKQQTGCVKQVDLSHNRSKQYILEEGKIVPLLCDLGVMTQEGKIVRTRFDKFRQINRFLEFIEDILPQLDKDREITILDFGCGKSYLTFAMYYYLHELKKYDVRIIGLDLKKEVIKHCNALSEKYGYEKLKSYLTFAMYYYLHELKKYDVRIIGLDLKKEVIKHCNALSEKYGYEKLKFLEGNIADYTGVNEVDMVVTLHACDTATDYALAKAVGWNAKVILSVPCCQHEANNQIKNETLEPILKYGACDTATDYALAKAVGWNAKVILSVPCCQHEANNQIKNETLEPILKYGLIKERISALVTDALRAEYLEREGYEAQILEFIDMEHTPKNILIRAVKTGRKSKNAEKIDALRAEYLEREGYEAQILEFIDMEHTPKNILIRAVKTGRKSKNAEKITACEEELNLSLTLKKLLDNKGEV